MKGMLVVLLACAAAACGSARHVVVDPGAAGSLASADWTIKSEPAKVGTEAEE
ncbi:MAG: hypothetical protein AB7U76_24015 [Pirellulales bacterium]